MTIKWSEQLVTDICDHISTGKSIEQIAKLKGYPSADSIYRQMYRDKDFAGCIARAREAQQDHEADACVRMADNATAEDWQLVKLRIWARQWRASKLAPKRYGDKIVVNHSGQVTQQHDLSALSANDLDALEQLVGKASNGAGDTCGTSPPGSDRVH